MQMNSFTTSDFVTAATLLLRKHRLITTDKSNPKRIVFEFEKDARLEEDLKRLAVGELLVDPTDFWNAERRCKQLIYHGQPQ